LRLKRASQSVEQFSILLVRVLSLDCVSTAGDREIVEAVDDWSNQGFAGSK
jgi:hypothetical protein